MYFKINFCSSYIGEYIITQAGRSPAIAGVGVGVGVGLEGGGVRSEPPLTHPEVYCTYRARGHISTREEPPQMKHVMRRHKWEKNT
jgi:hypothetical protein